MKNRVKKQALSFAAAMAMILGGGMQLYAADKIADTVYHNGKIYTIAETAQEAKDIANAKKADVVATLNGKIVFVGSEADAKAQGYLDAAKVNKIVDLRGKTMLPGFVDGHGHFPGESQIDLFNVNLNCPPLGPVVNMDDLVRLLKVKADNTKAGDWVQGSNYDDSMIAEKRHPNRDDLDKASTQHPVMAMHSSSHMCAVNSYVIEREIMPKGKIVGNEFILKDTGKAVDGVEIKDGRLTGMLYETNAMGLFTRPSLSTAQSLQLTARGSQAYAAAGVTTSDQGASMLASLPAYQNSVGNKDLNIRIILHPLTFAYGGVSNHAFLKWDTNNTPDPFDDAPTAASPKVGDDLTRLVVGQNDPSALPENYLLFGAWKQIYDGSNQGYTGYFKHPGYWDKGANAGNDPVTGKPDPNAPDALLGLNGTLNFPRETLIASMDFYTKNNQPVETHTNGSWAAEDYMTAIELAVANHPTVKDLRHTFIHGQMEERQIVERSVGKYDELDATAKMYRDLSGTARQEGTDTDAHGKQWTASDLRAALQNGKLIKAQNLVSSYFINHTYFWGDRHLEIYMGPGRGKQQNPQGWAAAYGHHFTSHNDTPVTPISGLRSIQSSVTRTSTGGQVLSGSSKDLSAKAMYPETKGGAECEFWDFDQRLNPLQAIHAVTVTPAYQNHIERLVGSIEEGKLADFAILDQDPIEVAATTPLEIQDIRVATTVVGDNVVHGFLPDADAFVSLVNAGYGQADGVTVSNLNSSPIDHATAEKNYGAIGKGEKRLGTLQFTANITEGKSGVFQFSFLGNGATVAEFKLYKLHDTTTDLYTYGKPAPEQLDSASGYWWIADMAAPTVPLTEADKLEMDKSYIAFFVIGDNDGTFDADDTLGAIKDPVSLVTTGSLPNNGNSGSSNDDGGSSSGCTVGSTPSYDLLVLFLGMSAVAAIRVLRRRNEQ